MSTYYNGEVLNMHGKILISKRTRAKGEDGYKTFSVRIKEDTVKKLSEIAKESNRSRNELINIILEYGVENFEIVE